MRGRFGGDGPRSVVRTFAWRSAIVFAIVAVGLHVLVSSAVTGHVRQAATFHAEFVAHSVLDPLLAERSQPDEPVHEAAGDPAFRAAIEAYAIDEHVVRILIWGMDGTVIASDDPSVLGASPPGYLDGVGVQDGALHADDGSLDAPATPGGRAVDDPVRSFIPLETGDDLVAEILQDPAMSIGAASSFSRLLDLTVVGGLALLWALLLPVARRASRRLDRQARTDDLTGLLNRGAVRSRLKDAVDHAGRAGAYVAVLFIDLDGFKAINEAGGHQAGDHVLRQVAARLRGQVRSVDAVGRFAGDEFVVIIDGVNDEVAAEQVAARTLETLREPIDGVGPHRLTASIGMSVGSTRSSADELLRDADAAMYEAKSDGGDHYRVFDDELRCLVARRQWIEREVLSAVDDDQLHLVFQPFVALQGERAGTVVAVEALLRWTHPEEGPIGPGEFIPIAETSGALHRLGPWIIDAACHQLATWQTELPAHAEPRIFVNLSPVELRNGLLDQLDDVLERTGADARGLGFEITETAILSEDDTSVVDTLAALRDRGCVIAVDDFGTGYSSLSRLRTMPIDLLKLDASFVGSLTSSRRELAISTAVAGLAQRLGVTVLAEGIETTDQLVAVRELGFDLAQGYHLARPAPPEEIVAYLSTAALPAGPPAPIGDRHLDPDGGVTPSWALRPRGEGRGSADAVGGLGVG